MIKHLFQNGISFHVPSQTIEDIFLAELEADNDEITVRILQIEIGKQVYLTIINEINSQLKF